MALLFNLASEICTAWGLPTPGSQALTWCGVDHTDEAYERMSRELWHELHKNRETGFRKMPFPDRPFSVKHPFHSAL
jgi:hypothetical protein